MHFENNIPDYELLAKYLAGEASAEETGLVEAWINNGNQEEFINIRAVWIASDSSSREFDVDKAFNSVNARIAKTGSRRRLNFMSIAAAAIVLIITIPLLILRFGGKTTESQMLSFISQDSVAKISMGDGSLLTLNSGSKIEYSEDFVNNRKVTLSGEAYFEVAHIDNNHKFTVEAKELEITVVGTKFNVKAIESSDIVEVSVTEGIVKVRQKDSENYIELRIGEKVSFNTNTGEFIKDSVSTVNDIYWITKKIVFDNAGLSEVASTLSSVYGVDVNIDMENSDSLRLNTSFENNSLDEVIKILELTLDIKIVKSGNSISFRNVE